MICDMNSVPVYLQNDSMDLVPASTIIDVDKNVLTEKRTRRHFEELLQKARSIAGTDGVSTGSKNQRIRRRKRMPGEEARDEQVTNPSGRFKSAVFMSSTIPSLENFASQISELL